jgi:hypothetical protein
MIYEYPRPDEPIRQGDIFQCVPRIEANLRELAVPIEEDLSTQDWADLAQTTAQVTALVALRPVTAIVITQDCDAARAEDIALCEIATFDFVEPSAATAKHPKGTMSLITKHARVNLKWFYLPPDADLGFHCKMAVDFQSVLRMPREYLQGNLAKLRLGRLKPIATEHFRERLAEYFRRYAYNEWYPLDKAEFEAYRGSRPEPIGPYPWQV